MMIQSFKHKGLEQFFTKNNKKLLNARDIPKISRILDRLDTAIDVNDINIPGWFLHGLKGDRRGVFSVTVQKNWRITFRWLNGDVFDVSLEDYH